MAEAYSRVGRAARFPSHEPIGRGDALLRAGTQIGSAGLLIPPKCFFRFVIRNLSAAGTVQFDWMILGSDGVLRPGQRTVISAVAQSSATAFVPASEGTLVYMQAVATDGWSEKGDIFCFVSLSFGGSGSAPVLGLILIGYPTALATLAFPGGVMQDALTSDNEPTQVQVTNPAAGADWTFAPINGGFKEVTGVHCRLVTGVAVPGRTLVLVLTGPSGVQWRVISASVQGASVTVDYHGAQWGYLPGAGAGDVYLPTPVFAVPNGWALGSLTSGLAAADQFSQIFITGLPYRI